MKSLEELAQIREKALLKTQGMTEDEADKHLRFTVTIGMATCGITAGARPVFTALLECMTAEGDETVKILQTGCFGKCSEEPMMKVEDFEGHVYFYGKLNADKVAEIYEKHLQSGQPVNAYLIEMEQS